jgi:TIR domain
MHCQIKTHGPALSCACGARPFRLSDARCSRWCACGHAEWKLQARGQDEGDDQVDARGERAAALGSQVALKPPANARSDRVSKAAKFCYLPFEGPIGCRGRDMPEPAPIRYRAFMSYSHHDRAFAKWLHKALEGFRIDKDLVGRKTPIGAVPKSLRPIFRDREDFAAGHSLTEQTIAALEASQFLIVLCSPSAARSEYVNQEIRRFKALGRGKYVIPVIVDGARGCRTGVLSACSAI